MILVSLGNPSPREMVTADDGSQSYAPVDTVDAVTHVQIPDEIGLAEAFQTITLPNGAWDRNAAEPPSWVSSTSSTLATLLADHFGCPTRKVTT